MHDFLLSKQIKDELKKIVLEKHLDKAKSVSLEIGNISMSHDGHPEHLEEISLENLKFGLESLAKGTNFEKASFKIKKAESQDWKITDIEVE